MILAAHQPQYIPWLGYFDKIGSCDCFVFLDDVQYKHREFQNRNKIRAKGSWLWLSVPVEYKGHSRQKISEVRINNDTDWPRKHLGSLKNNYSGADFFSEHIPFFEEVYSKEWHRLIDINMRIIHYIIKYLGISTPLYFESQIKTSAPATDRLIEICRKLNADTYLSGSGGRAYLEEEKFSRAGIRLEYQHYIHPVYNQQPSNETADFIPYMSVVDLLFNQGQKSYKALKSQQGVC